MIVESSGYPGAEKERKIAVELSASLSECPLPVAVFLAGWHCVFEEALGAGRESTGDGGREGPDELFVLFFNFLDGSCSAAAVMRMLLNAASFHCWRGMSCPQSSSGCCKRPVCPVAMPRLRIVGGSLPARWQQHT